MRNYLRALLVTSACLVSQIAQAQIVPIPPAPPTSPCPNGLQPDGFIDWSGLPPAPILNGSTPTPPVSATLPVTGVPGLSAMVTIPPLILPPDSGANGMPAYVAMGDKLHLNGLGTNGNTFILIAFNKAIRGLSAEANSTGEFPFTAFVSGGGPISIGSVGGTMSFTFTPSWGDNFFPVGGPVQFRITEVPMSSISLNLTTPLGIHGYAAADWTNVRIESGSAPDLSQGVPTDGLQLWLASDTVVNGKINNSLTWYDLSPVGQDASIANAPFPQPAPFFGTYSAPTCRPVYSFTGNEYLNFIRDINGLNRMTILLVAKADQTPPAPYGSSNSAIFWQENERWGNTYLSPYAGYVTWRFGTTKTNTDHIYTRPKTSGGDLDITMSVHDEDTESLWINGERVQEFKGNRSVLDGTTGAAVLGEGLNGTPFNGRIAEVLVWNRTLTDSERVAVDHYLKTKYGVR
jgi:hypothetical protein